MGWIRPNPDKANKANEAARLASGNSGKSNRNGDMLGVTRAEREKGQRILDEMVANKEITKRGAKRAMEDALRQAGGSGDLVSRLSPKYFAARKYRDL